MLVLAAIAACRDEAQVVEQEMTLTENRLIAMETLMQEHTAEVSITVPDSLWSVSIKRVVQTSDHIAIVAQLTKSDGMGMMVISQVSDAVSFTAADLPIKYYVMGKAWNWENSEAYEFVSDISTLDSLTGVEIEFTRVESTSVNGPKKHELM